MLAVDARPQLLELALGEVIGQRVLGDFLPGAPDHAVERVRVIDASHQRLDRLGMGSVGDFLGQLHDEILHEGAVLDGLAELGGRLVVVVDEVALVKSLVDALRLLLGEGDRLTVEHDVASAEQVHLHLLRALAQALAYIGLQIPHERLVALRRDHGEQVHAVHLVGSQQSGVLAVAFLVDGQAHAAADLLALARLRAGLLERAYLEDVRVVPALAQRRVAENEAHGLIERKQALLIAQDQVIGTLRVVVVDADTVLALRLLLGFRLDGVALLVHREVAGVHRARLESSEVLRVGGVEDVVLRRVLQSVGDDGLVLLFENLAVAHGFAVAGEVAVLRDLVDEEKAQALDAAAKQRLLLLQVAQDRLTYLYALHVVGGGVAVDLADVDAPVVPDRAVQEAHVARVPILGRDHAVVAARNRVAAVRFELRRTAGIVDAVALPEACGLLAHLAAGSHALELDNCLGGAVLAHHDVAQVQITVGSSHVLEGEALHLDALDEFLVVGVQGVQGIHQVVLLLVSCRVAQHEQRVEAGDALLGRASLLSHLLGLVADDDGAVRSDDVDGPSAAELVALVEDDARRLVLCALLHRRVERLHVDDHAVYVARLGVRIQLGQVVRVVYEEPNLLVVLREEVLLGVLQALGHALADGDRWHHHDELAPAVQAVELEHRLGVDVGLAGARLHLDVQLTGSHAAEKLL